MGGGGSKSESFNLEVLTQKLGGGEFKNIVIMCGAGISTNAGIPDFRSPSAGLYMTLRSYDLPYPEAVFEGRYFNQDPKPFYTLGKTNLISKKLCKYYLCYPWVRSINVSPFDPAVWSAIGNVLLYYLDTTLRNKKHMIGWSVGALEYLAGVPQEKIVEAHGSFRTAYCVSCKETYDLRWLKQEIFHPSSTDGVPHCSACKQGVVRPDVVLFGEPLSNRFYENIDSDFNACDLLLVFGTSLVVSPFNQLVGKPGSSVPRVYINKTKPGAATSMLAWMMRMGANIEFSRPSDLILLGDCDKQGLTINIPGV
ncbi:NAD-dependent protein deacetylase Sirt2 [Eurytemora carolleeae]|uniref:NAD-dependent protein deacetylase Sirt2 n=1 Tax=Eurytemora carolleeae TaxID=1294199 RepID=UPI000C759A8B|nr:NAD-dependent protein deacetylase Sirt2 [Eurytemora carolleeae]|eukprot:XP_023340427.1 NAD-dependent protein deacetylase Sirt2-like [Eurytemora affinis]